MSKALDEVLAATPRLDPKARAEIVTEPLASLAGPPDPGAEAAWEEEFRRRLAAMEAGTVKLEPWDVMRRRIEKARGAGQARPPKQPACLGGACRRSRVVRVAARGAR
jgi:putative addiction module component (TIGR02574 family)